MDKITVTCEVCGARYRVAASSRGQKRRCRCGQVVIIREASRPAAGESPSQSGGWYHGGPEAPAGPFTIHQLKRRLRSGRVAADEKVLDPRTGRWIKARKVRALASEFGTSGRDLVGEIWYWKREERRKGPLSLGAIVRAARRGEIRHDDRVWSNRLRSWQWAEKVNELRREFARGTERHGVLWYCRTEGQKSGPMKVDRLRQLVRSGEVRGTDLVCNKQLDEWRPVFRVEELRAALRVRRVKEEGLDVETEAWYFRKDGQERGPVSAGFLVEMAVEGWLAAETPVSGPRLDDWRPLAQVPGLAVAFEEVEETYPAQEQTSKSARRQRRWRVITRMVPSAAAALAILAFFAYVFGWPGQGAEPGERGRGAGPPAAERMVRAWLVLFLQDRSAMTKTEREALARRLSEFYPDGYLDVYSRGLWRALSTARQRRSDASLLVEELPCEALRAEDGQNFCYHLPFSGDSVSVEAAVPAAGRGFEEVEKDFRRDQFVPLLRFRVGLTGGDSTQVLVTSRKGEHRIVAFGRAALMGAAAGGKRVHYLTGYKSGRPSEAEALMRPGTEQAVQTQAQSWEAYGGLMSLDCTLVPRSARLELRQALQNKSSRPWLLVFASPRVDMDAVAHRYGPAQSEEEITVADPRFEVVSGSGGELYARLTVHYYGRFGLATEPGSKSIVALAFKRPLRGE